MKIIKVPKPSPDSANKDRKLGSLIEAQVRNLHALELTLAKKHQLGKAPEEIKTEREAAEYIRHVTQKLLEKPRAVKKLIRPNSPEPLLVERIAAKAEKIISEGKELVGEGKSLVGEGKELVGEGKELIKEGRTLIKKVRGRVRSRVKAKVHGR